MARKGENIYKRSDGRWEGRYIRGRKPDGRAQYGSIYGKTYTEVRERLKTLKAEKEPKQKRCPLTVKELLDLWLESRQRKVKASSYARYVVLVEGHILPEMGRCSVNSLTAKKLSSYIEYLLQHGRLDGRGGLSAKTVSDIVIIFKSALRLAKKHYSLPDPELLEVEAPAFHQRRVETLGDHETARLSDAVLAAPDLSGAAYLLCLNTGLRLGELCALKWSDFDFTEGTLRVGRTALRRKEGGRTLLAVQSPKSESSRRIIPLTAQMLNLFSSLRGSASDDVYILTQTSSPMEPRTMQYRFHSFLKRHRLRSHNFHALRHTFATRCIARGADAKTLSEILGHSNVKTTLQLYVHPGMELKRTYIAAASTFAA